MSGKPKIYLCGACEALPDLGVAWRREAALAVTEAGGLPVWPPGIKSLADGKHDAADARAAWNANRRGEILADLQALLDCDGVLVLVDGKEGCGTAAEMTVAYWMAVPAEIVHHVRYLGSAAEYLVRTIRG